MKTTIYKTPASASRAIANANVTPLYSGDCMDLLRAIPDGVVDLTITSPPYCMGKEYEKSQSVEDFIAAHEQILPEIVRVTRDGGSICWQVGYHTARNQSFPLDYAVFSILNQVPGVALRNRILWTFGHGLHGTRRFSGRHETVLWFTKGDNYYFDLDAVRVPQKYPGKRHYKGPRKGEYSGNPRGKNPGDVWEIPNVKGSHVEKVNHPCQFPVALAQRLVRGLCPKSGTVLDPFLGSGSTGIAAIVEGRRFVGAEVKKKYAQLARDRLAEAHAGTIRFRPSDRPIFIPRATEAVTRRPDHFFMDDLLSRKAESRIIETHK